MESAVENTVVLMQTTGVENQQKSKEKKGVDFAAKNLENL